MPEIKLENKEHKLLQEEKDKIFDDVVKGNRYNNFSVVGFIKNIFRYLFNGISYLFIIFGSFYLSYCFAQVYGIFRLIIRNTQLPRYSRAQIDITLDIKYYLITFILIILFSIVWYKILLLSRNKNYPKSYIMFWSLMGFIPFSLAIIFYAIIETMEGGGCWSVCLRGIGYFIGPIFLIILALIESMIYKRSNCLN